MMLDMAVAAAGAAAGEVRNWADLGLKTGIDLGFFTLRYYSLAYLVGILFAYWHTSRILREPGAPMAQRHADDLFFWCTLGIILGGRLGYATFYQPSLWTDFSGEGFVSWGILRLWDGGMSFHGGLLGVTAAMMWVSWRNKLSIIRVFDYVSVSVGMGMLLGRIANFINGELWGRPADASVPWAMAFPGGGDVLRHPSQLYQAGLEGLLVLAVMLALFWFTKARYRAGLLSGTFVVLISAGRFIAEFYREPDAQLAALAEQSGLSMGQWLTLPLLAAGMVMVIVALARPAAAPAVAPAPAQQDAAEGAA